MGPLAGVKVVELQGIGPGPYCGMMLADMGAEIIRVDRSASVGTPANTTDILARGRKSIAVDLKNPAGVETVLKLVAEADVLIEGFRPGVMERLGLGPDVCLQRNPRLVYGRMTGWGQDGPLEVNAPMPLRSHSVTAFRTESNKATMLRQWCQTKAGLTLGIGLGMADVGAHEWHHFFRLGHMGHVNAQMILGALATIEAGLKAVDLPY